MGYWAKLYTDILEDKKVIRDMTDVGQLGMFFAILVAKKNDSEFIGTVDDLVFESRKTQEFWNKALSEMETVKIVDQKDGIFRLINWEKRQATIDGSERTRQSRAKKNAQQVDSVVCNEDVTQIVNALPIRYGEKEIEKEEELEIEKENKKKVFSGGTSQQLDNHKEMITYFSEKTGIPEPNIGLAKTKWEWWDAIAEMLQLHEWNLAKTKDHIDQAIRRADEKRLTFANPQGLLKIYLAIHAEEKRGVNISTQDSHDVIKAWGVKGS